LDIKLRIYMSLENQFARRFELSCDEEFLFAWLCYDGCFIF